MAQQTINNRPAIWWYTILLLFFPLSALAQSAQSLFDQGVEVARQGDDEKALELFEAAAKLGMDSPKLYYNLGVSHYRSGHWRQSREAFLIAAQHPPLRTLSHYNLGLVAEQQGETSAAKEWFRKVYQEGDQLKLKALAADKLGIETAQTETGKQWFKGLSVSMGYDDNLLDPTVVGGTNRGDSYTSVLAYATAIVDGDFKDGIRIGANAYLIRYNDIGSYDMDLYQANLMKSLSIDRWQTRGAVYIEQSKIGGTNYLKAIKGEIRGTVKLDKNEELTTRYRYSNYSAASSQYDPLGGVKHELNFEWQIEQQKRQLLALYELEYNDRNDFQTATTFTSYSPTRHTVEGRLRYPLDSKWELRSRLGVRASEYHDAHTLAGGIKTVRKDTNTYLGLEVIRPVYQNVDLQIEYRYTDNDSNIGDYDYTRNLYKLGFSATF